MGIMLNLSTSTLRMFGVMKAGRLGPILISLIPKYSSDNRMATAFCSYQEITKDSGRSLTPTLNASANAVAILTAE